MTDTIGVDSTLVLLIWKALQACGLDYAGAFSPPVMQIAMPFIREQAALEEAER